MLFLTLSSSINWLGTSPSCQSGLGSTSLESTLRASFVVVVLLVNIGLCNQCSIIGAQTRGTMNWSRRGEVEEI